MTTTDGTPDPTAGLPDPPAVSMQTLAVTGILVDVYGLDELPSPALTHVSVLWLHNPRLGDRTRMAPIAKRVVAEYNKIKPGGSTRGLIAAAFDMFGITIGTVVDTQLLITALPGYLFLDSLARGAPAPPAFDQHLVLGISLGGHSTWQTLFTNPAVTAGVGIIGCPDFQHLMSDRAIKSKRPSATAATTGGESFVGSADFPPALVAQCAEFDPRAIVFGTGPVVEAPGKDDQARIKAVLDKSVKGKRFLLCSGGADKLVPWRCSEAFTRFFVGAADGWYKESGLRVDNRVYDGVGHECSDGMVVDAVRFLVAEVVGAGTGPAGARI
ncbi:hypothetical protein N0V82_002782 [Gnomoniopsis sp. IMI 355080]|nr:hypothetical protein N0V82_002782 [Gnomoniopsis sp. IMI 355080]